MRLLLQDSQDARDTAGNFGLAPVNGDAAAPGSSGQAQAGKGTESANSFAKARGVF
ncbi:MAG: hypothetical protein WA875_00290 [Candidatus Acidiferrales bacterium]